MAERRKVMGELVVVAVSEMANSDGSSIKKIIDYIKKNLLEADGLVKTIPTISVMKALRRAELAGVVTELKRGKYVMASDDEGLTQHSCPRLKKNERERRDAEYKKRPQKWCVVTCPKTPRRKSKGGSKKAKRSGSKKAKRSGSKKARRSGSKKSSRSGSRGSSCPSKKTKKRKASKSKAAGSPKKTKKRSASKSKGSGPKSPCPAKKAKKAKKRSASKGKKSGAPQSPCPTKKKGSKKTAARKKGRVVCC